MYPCTRPDKEIVAKKQAEILLILFKQRADAGVNPVSALKTKLNFVIFSAVPISWARFDLHPPPIHIYIH